MSRAQESRARAGDVLGRKGGVRQGARHRLRWHRLEGSWRHPRSQWPAGSGVRSQDEGADQDARHRHEPRSEEHTSELQSLMRISYAVFCLKKKKKPNMQNNV